MNLIPKTSTPLTKSIRTLEGILVIACNSVLVVVPIATSALSAATAVKYGTFINMSFIISRGLLKAVASTATETGIQPQLSAGEQAIPQDIGAVATSVVQQVPEVAQGGAENSPANVIQDIADDIPEIEKVVTDAEEAANPAPPAPAES